MAHLQKNYIQDGRWKMQHYFFASFYRKISWRKWDFMSLFFKRFLTKLEWFMQMKNRCSWTKFTSPKKVSLSVLLDFRFLVTNNSCYVLYWACEQSVGYVFLGGWYDYCFAYYEVHYFPAASFCTVLMTSNNWAILSTEQQRKWKF